MAKLRRRQFTAENKLWILEETDRYSKPGEIDRILRSEGLYSFHLTAWHEARHGGHQHPRARGRHRTRLKPARPRAMEGRERITRGRKREPRMTLVVVGRTGSGVRPTSVTNPPPQNASWFADLEIHRPVMGPEHPIPVGHVHSFRAPERGDVEDEWVPAHVEALPR